MKSLLFRFALAVAVSAAPALARITDNTVQMTLRLVNVTGSATTSPGYTRGTVGGTPAPVAAGSTLIFEVQYTMNDTGTGTFPAGLVSGSMNITGSTGTYSVAPLSKSMASTGGGYVTVTDTSGPPTGAATGEAGVERPYRGGFSNAANNADSSNGTATSTGFTQIVPLSLSQSLSNPLSAGGTAPNVGWIGLYLFQVTVPANAASGTFTISADFQADPGTGTKFGFFDDGVANPDTSNNAVAGTASFQVVDMGGCCVTGSCTLTSSSLCMGTFRGDGSSCSPNPCSSSLACCDATSGACSIAATSCPTGTVPNGTTCSPSPCPIACCNNISAICSIVTGTTCSAGTSPNGTACSPSPCPIACCNAVSGACTIVTTSCPTGTAATGTTCTPSHCPIACCNTTTGICNITIASCAAGSLQNGTICSPSPCPVACCNTTTGACIFLTGVACPGGTAQNGTTCTPSPCPLACCNATTGTCTSVAASCPGGTSQLGTVCSPNPCPQPSGSCCSAATGACTSVVHTACTGTWTQGASCSPNPCPPPSGSCCIAATGACTFILQSACVSGTWTQGASCSPNPCPQPSGSCCNSATGACTSVVQTACTGGTWTLAGSCTPNLCPQPSGACCNTTSGACTAVVQSVCSGGAWTQNGSCTPNPCPGPPVITLQPQSANVCAGTRTVFSIRSPALLGRTFHWRKNSVRIPGATNNTLVIPSPTVSDAGTYDCVVINSVGRTISNAAVLSVNPGPPVITVQPLPLAVASGMSATFRVRAPGTGNKTFQWRKDGVDIFGANANIFTINSVGLSDAGHYRCIINNACGTARSNRVALVVTNGQGPAPSTIALHNSPSISPTPTDDTDPSDDAASPGGTPAFASQPRHVEYVQFGGNATFTAAPATADPGQSVRWSKNGETLSDTNPHISGSGTSTLTISNVERKDLGLYAAALTSGTGTTSSAFGELTLCPADFNASGTVTVQDIFTFLSAWFAANPAADFNDDGSIAAQDVLDFLDAWFSGCN